MWSSLKCENLLPNVENRFFLPILVNGFRIFPFLRGTVACGLGGGGVQPELMFHLRQPPNPQHLQNHRNPDRCSCFLFVLAAVPREEVALVSSWSTILYLLFSSVVGRERNDAGGGWSLPCIFYFLPSTTFYFQSCVQQRQKKNEESKNEGTFFYVFVSHACWTEHCRLSLRFGAVVTTEAKTVFHAKGHEEASEFSRC